MHSEHQTRVCWHEVAAPQRSVIGYQALKQNPEACHPLLIICQSLREAKTPTKDLMMFLEASITALIWSSLTRDQQQEATSYDSHQHLTSLGLGCTKPLQS